MYKIKLALLRFEDIKNLIIDSISHCTLASFYPEEDTDTRLQTSC